MMIWIIFLDDHLDAGWDDGLNDDSDDGWDYDGLDDGLEDSTLQIMLSKLGSGVSG